MERVVVYVWIKPEIVTCIGRSAGFPRICLRVDPYLSGDCRNETAQSICQLKSYRHGSSDLGALTGGLRRYRDEIVVDLVPNYEHKTISSLISCSHRVRV